MISVRMSIYGCWRTCFREGWSSNMSVLISWNCGVSSLGARVTPWDGLYPLRLFKSTSCWSPFLQRNTRLGIHHHQWRRCLLCCFLALILSWQKLELDRWTHCIFQLMVVLQFFASHCRGMVAKLWLMKRMITEIFLLKSWWFFLINFLEVKWCEFLRVCWRGVFVVKFNTIRNNTLQDTGSKWFGLEFFKHQVARLIDEYHIEIFSFAAYTLLWRYHTGISRSQITMDHYKWYFFV